MEAHQDPDGVRRTPTEADRALLAFVPPPPGHKDWLTVDLPGLQWILMTTVDLTTPHAAPENLLDGLPRRVALTLPELRLVAERAGNAPLPFDVTEPRPGALEDRMGQSRGSAEDSAYPAALATPARARSTR